jgi:hypothetical protein
MLRRLTRKAGNASSSANDRNSANIQTDFSDDSSNSPFSSPAIHRPVSANEKSTTTNNLAYATDSTAELFSKPHTISILICMLLAFMYVALYITDIPDTVRNVKMYATNVHKLFSNRNLAVDWLPCVRCLSYSEH